VRSGGGAAASELLLLLRRTVLPRPKKMSKHPNWATAERLEQTQLARARDSFGASLHLEFVEDSTIVPFDCTQGQKKPRANFAIRESLGHELEYF